MVKLRHFVGGAVSYSDANSGCWSRADRQWPGRFLVADAVSPREKQLFRRFAARKTDAQLPALWLRCQHVSQQHAACSESSGSVRRPRSLTLPRGWRTRPAIGATCSTSRRPPPSREPLTFVVASDGSRCCDFGAVLCAWSHARAASIGLGSTPQPPPELGPLVQGHLCLSQKFRPRSERLTFAELTSESSFAAGRA